MKRCEVDQAVFYHIEEESVMALASHVNNCSAIMSSVKLENEIKTVLEKAFEISDLGEINWILVIAVKHDRMARTTALSQKSYINSMLTQYGFENIKSVAMPMDPSMHFSTSQSPIKCVFAYLAGMKDLWLTYGDSMAKLEGYMDADRSVHKDRKAVSGYAFLLDGKAVSWSLKKQEIITLLMTKAEYMATTHTAKEALWL